MGLSFQEKSLWLMLVSVVATFAVYFYVALATALPTPAARNVMPHQVVYFVIAVIALVVVQVAGLIVFAAMDRRTTTDERDRLIALKGTRNGSYVLATGVFFALCVALRTEGNFVFMHVLLAFWVLAQLTETVSQLYFYRRGA